MFSLRFPGRIKTSRLTRLAAQGVVVAFGAASLVAAPAAPAAASDLSCDSWSEAELCRGYSEVLLGIMDVVQPGSAGRLAARLAAGYVVEAPTTITCVLGASCDAWPVAVKAAQAMDSSEYCPLGDDSVCLAVEVAIEDVEDEVEAELRAIWESLREEHVDPHTFRLAQRVTELTQDYAWTEPFVDSVVGVVALALTLPPATSPDSLVPSPLKVSGADVVWALDRDEVLGCGAGGSDACVEAVRASECVVVHTEFADLLTYDSTSFNKFVIEGWVGTTNFMWADPFADHSWCPYPELYFTGSVNQEAKSNAGSFLASTTKNSPGASGTRSVTVGSPDSAAIWESWETSKAEIEYDFPMGFVIHAFSPPYGNYKMRGTGHTTIPGYRAVDTNRPYRDYRFTCNKYGSDPAKCTTRRTA